MVLPGCGEPGPDDVGTTSGAALVATINGTIRDGQGRPLPNVAVQLNGRTQARVTTGNAGTYSFPLNIPEGSASWAVMPTRAGCTFNPTVTNLNAVNGNRTANFTGTGTTCTGVAAPANPTIVATDPGPRRPAAGDAVTGGPLTGLAPQEQTLFVGSQEAFEEVDSVSGDGFLESDGITHEDGSGLGPTFNGNACKMCHGEPATGGTSLGLLSPINPVPNPQIALATLRGATNTIPSFISNTTPSREARFPVAAGGGVAGLFTIRGRDDAPGCAIAQPNFAAQVTSGDIIFRIATPVFGLGLMENTPDATLAANLAAEAGVSGRLNTSGNDGTVTKFGWKAQNKSLVIFAGEAYNVEQGVSNEVFTNERSAVAGCVFNGSPEDHTNNEGLTDPGSVSDFQSDAVLFAAFMRFLAPPAPVPGGYTAGANGAAATTVTATSIAAGATQFAAAGCAQCHTPSLTTGPSPYTPLANVTYRPFSDIAVHNMGTLADGVPQGAAGSDEFRSAPLWGAGQRLFFLHDGRTSSVVAAIQAHFSTGSEASQSVTNMAAMSTANQQAIVNFIRSL